MSTVLAIVNFVVANHQEILAAITMILTGVIGLFLFIPGEQPEKALRAVVAFIAKFSKKPAVTAEAPKAE